MKDKKHVNFGEEYELNNRLRANGLRQTQENRDKLTELGNKTKEKLEKRVITHEDLDNALKQEKDKFD
ncbi:hypothetical protein [Vibrio fluvialis]|uniref:Uncharacterized protein n=1 Tax=Vibrio fluvialis PG41 TaxID=1336752 RepID=S7JRX2_VIBFL|nr:hypothetical protein [Vibrio fluvialis]EKO3497116.1 hypothetical protein [Vibrio fluvialis]EPP24975.1 hypothetical protein L910_0124 [Vibrio fluvialis PG41]WIE04449.1 hypothetical protein QN061_06635 [Vibrio fluvialis]